MPTLATSPVGGATRAETAQQDETKPASFKMGSLGRHSLIYAAGMVLTKAIAFLMLPVYTRLLTPADYGVLQLISMFLEVLSIFAGSRIAYGIFHFYHKANDEEAKRTVLSTAILLLTATFGLAAIATLTLAPAIAMLVFREHGAYVTYIRLAAISMAFESLIVVPNALFQIQQKSIRFVTFSLVRLGMQLALNLLLLIVFDMGVAGVLLSAVISNFLVGGFLAVRLLAMVRPRFSWPDARAFLRFGLPLVAMQIATFTFTFGDRYFLNKAGDTTAVGLYGLAYQFGFLVGMIGYMPLEMVWDPQRFAIAKRPDRDAIYSRVLILFNVTLISTAVGISLFVGDVLHLIAAPAFQSAAAFVPIIVGAYIFQAWGTFFNIGIMITERTHLYTVANWAAALIALLGYFLLIPKYLAWGASLTIVASLGTRFWLTYLFSQRLWYIRYDWMPVLRLLGLAAGFATVAFFAPRLSLAPSVLLHTAMFATYALMVWLFILAEKDRVAMKVAFARARAFLK